MQPVNDTKTANEKRGGKKKIDHELADVNFGTALGLFDFNTRGEGIFEFIKMRDDKYFCKIMFDEIDRFDEPLASLRIL